MAIISKMLPLPSLHLNSEYSFQESTVRLDALINFATLNQLKALVLTDHNNLFAAFDFIAQCQKAKLKPIIGLDLDVEDFRLILLARNYAGYQELARLSSRKMREEQIKHDQIDTSNLFVIDHPTLGHYAKTKNLLALKNYYVPTEEKLVNAVNVLATQVLSLDDNEALAILRAQASGTDLKVSTAEAYQYLYDPNDVRTQVNAYIIEQCNVVFPQVVSYLPTFTKPEAVSSHEYLKLVVTNGARKVLGAKLTNEAYQERLKFELEVIAKLNFSDYFLIIWDIVQWAKKEGIAIGPGRGSAAGSLVTYVLGITEIDPLAFDLLFERFLNPDRISMPDIDIDIQDNRRYEVVRYLFAKYGPTHVAQISTFAMIGAKTALRDTARVFNVPARDVNALTKLLFDDLSLREAYQKNARFRAAINASEIYTKVFNLATKLEGLPRQTGTHAAGIVIASMPIEERFATTIGTEGLNQVQLSMNYLEANGLLKIDLLGLRSLTILQNMELEVFKSYNKHLDIAHIPLSDAQTNALLSEGDTNGVFQLESFGMKSTLVKVQVDSFNDVVAIISLYRPGPMENISVYAERKNAQSAIPQTNAVVDQITAETYGIIIYQEQIMRIAQNFAGLTFAQADILRRAIGKKDAKLIQSMKQAFLNGAADKNYSALEAAQIFALIEKFADYGFNKSHAVAYGLLAYRMAYVKARFKREFYTALIEVSTGSQEAIKRYVTEARANHILVVAPSISLSKTATYLAKGQIFLPLTIIKGVGQSIEQKVLAEREKESFSNFFSAIARLKLAEVGEQALTTLVQAHAFREFGNVETLLDALPSALRYSELIKLGKGTASRLDFSLMPTPELMAVPRNLLQEMDFDREFYGFLLNAFPTEGFELATKLVTLKNEAAAPVVLYFKELKTFKDKNNQDYAVAFVLDSTAEVGLTVFSRDFVKISQTPPGSLVKAQVVAKEFNSRLAYNLVRPWEILKHG